LVRIPPGVTNNKRRRVLTSTSSNANTHNSKLVQGFTLIELVITLILAAIIVIPFTTFVVETIRGAVLSGDMVVAINLARLDLEKTNNMKYEDIGNIDDNNYEGYNNYHLRRTVTYIEGSAMAPGVKEIKVKVLIVRKNGEYLTEELLTTAITHRTSYSYAE